MYQTIKFVDCSTFVYCKKKWRENTEKTISKAMFSTVYNRIIIFKMFLGWFFSCQCSGHNARLVTLYSGIIYSNKALAIVKNLPL
jgi:hypothetical protein